jgi:hypothetical protein
LFSPNSLAEHFALLVRKDGFRSFRVGSWKTAQRREMPKVTRRSFIAGATAAAAAGVAGTGVVAAAAAATATTAGTAQAATSGLGTIQHVIIFMGQ